MKIPVSTYEPVPSYIAGADLCPTINGLVSGDILFLLSKFSPYEAKRAYAGEWIMIIMGH